MYLSRSKDDLTADTFSSAPAIPHLNIPPLNQAPKSGSSEKSSNGNAKMSSRGREFVCLIRGETDLSHQHAYFVPPPDARHVGERAAILELIISKWSLTHNEFTLEHPENIATIRARMNGPCPQPHCSSSSPDFW